MKRLLFRGKYTILGALITILTLFSLWHLNDTPWGAFIWLLYLTFFGYYLGQFFLASEKRFWQIFFGTLGVISIITIILSVIYWFYAINPKIISFVIIITPLLISLQKRADEDVFANIETNIDLESYAHLKSYLSTKLLIIVVLLGQLLMFFVLLSRSFGDTLLSPWTIIGKNFFIFFAFITFILLWILQKSKHNASSLLIISTHTVLILSVALIIFKYGFGFDPHIHEATEQWIVDHGSILPKQPYYIGQYMLVIISHFITKFSIITLDKLIVPIGAGIFFPFSLYFAFSRLDLRYKIFPALALIPLIPLSFFIVTTPNNFALLVALITSAWIWYESKFSSFKTNIFGLLLTLLACSIHPFIGLPLLIIYLGSILFFKTKHHWKKLFYPLYIILLTIITPLALFGNSLRNANSLTFQNPLNNLNDFFSIFARPHYIFIERGDALLKILYYYRDTIKPLVILTIILGFYLAIKKYILKQTTFFLVTILSLFLSAFILITSVKLADVISYDQKLYGMRLLEMILVICIPFFILCLRELFIFVRNQPLKQITIAFVFSGLLLISWFFTYPTRDKISLFTGYNIREADIIAVQAIDSRNNGVKDYIVLTNQTVASAALRQFSFAKYLPTSVGDQYFYSIPTGGPLYQYFRKMVYEEPKREWMEEAMKFAGVKKAYFVHTNYWYPAAEIRDKAKLEADKWWELAGGRVWVYEYILKQ